MVSKYYKIHEFVPKKMYKRYGQKAWRYIPSALIELADALKEQFPKGSISINNYMWGGDRQWSGIRTPESQWYSYGSQHSYGNAIDMKFSDYNADEVRKWILDNIERFQMIKGIEIGVSWVHVDIRNEDDVVLFDAKGNLYDYKDNEFKLRK